jgi:hypothetical protein
MSFDYKRAWRELAKPQYKQLPKEVKQVFQQVIRECSKLNQASDTLDVPFPETDLRSKMEALDNDLLAHAARVIYFFGHWSSVSQLSSVGGGAYWKFANLADQVLRTRHGVSKDDKGRTGILIIEGYVRVYYSTRNIWTWMEVGPATEEIVERARKLSKHFPFNEPDVWLKSIVEECKPLCDDNSRLWLTTDEYTT